MVNDFHSGGSTFKLVCLFVVGKAMYETQCMKRRCFEPNCSSLTLQQPPSLFLSPHLPSLTSIFALLTPLWTDDCTVSIKLENTFVNSFTTDPLHPPQKKKT